MGNYFVYPTPKCSYEHSNDDATLIYVPQKIEGTYCGTLICAENRKKSTKIPCRYITCQNYRSPYLLMFFHGNSEDIGFHLTVLLTQFSERFAMDVICPEYPSYGIYKTKDESLRMDEAMMNDAKRVLKYCTTQLKYKYENIILIGRSLGTGVVSQLAAEFKVRGVVLISPFTSIRDIAKNLVGSVLSKVVPDVFRNIDYMDKLKCPILIVHGEEDVLIHYSMAKALYDRAITPKILRINELMTHNQFKLEVDVFAPMHSFMVGKLELRHHLSSRVERMIEVYETKFDTTHTEELLRP